MLNDTTTPERHRTGDLLSRSREVFVSPRVIDQNAYSKYSNELRASLGRIASETEALHQSTDEARKFIDDVNAKKDQRRSEIESVTKLLRAADVRAKRIDETVRNAQAHLDSMGNIEETAQKTADRKAKEIESRIEGILSSFEARLEDRAADREQRFLWAAQETEEIILERLGELRAENSRAIAIIGRPPGSPADSPVSHESLLDVLRRTDEGNARLGDLRRRVAECDYKARDSVEALEQTLDESLQSSEQLKRAHEELGSAAMLASKTASNVESTLTTRADELADLSASLSSLVDRAGSSTAGLRDVIDSCESLHKHSDARYDELTALTETITGLVRHLEHWKPLLEPDQTADGEAAPLPPALRRIVDEFRSGLMLDIARLADAVTSVVDRNTKPM